uniref:Uncharacterized protein n=1 Tax=Tanacetum cinerariifolium TaxID=118510 RepID=A0A6L2P0K1_TANCI|nr:hypothetical protein [Tanacetum cinerariifolium]
MIKELDNQGQEKITPRKLFNEEAGGAGSENSQASPSAEEVRGYSFDGSSRSRSQGRSRFARKHQKNISRKKGISKSHRSVRSEARSRSKSKSVKSKPQPMRASRRKSNSDSGYDIVSDSGSEDLSMPYRRPKPIPFTSRITRLRYYRRAKLPPNVQTLSGSARNWFDSLDPKSVDGFEELSNKFLEEFSQQKREETVSDTIEVIRTPRREKSAGKASWLENQNGSRNRGHRRGEWRSMGTYAPYARREGFTPLTKTPKEIFAMDNVNFPPPLLMVGILEKRSMNKFYNYHQDRGHNTNDYYHLKKQIEEVTTLGRLAHLMKDIMQGGQKGKGSAKGEEKVINMWIPWLKALGLEGYMLMVVVLQRLCTSIVLEILAIGRDRGRTGMRSLGVVASTIHSMIKFPTSNGIATVATTKETLRECRQIEEAQALSWHARVIDPSPREASLEVASPRALLALVETRSRRPGKEPMKLDDIEERQALIHTLQKNVDIFAQTLADMTSIPRAITEHNLDTYPHIEPKVHKKRSLTSDMRNVVTMKLMNSSRLMTKKDDEKTAFHMEEGVLCYTKMPFGLKNAGATYQRLVDFAFKEQIGVNLEAYADDMVVKSRNKQDIIKDVEQTLSTLRRINMKLNPKKCSFGMEEGKFLGWTEAAEAAFLEMKKLVSELPTLTTPKKGETLMRLYTDEASNNRGSGAGHILIAPKDMEYSYVLCLNLSNSNNDAEYEALLVGLQIATKMQVKDIHAFVDSKLVASRVEGSYEAKGKRMIKYQEKVFELAGAFNRFRITHIPRVENKKADALSKLTAVQFDHFSKDVPVEVMNVRSVEAQEVNMVVEEEGPTWMTSIQNYLEKGELPKDTVDARTLMEKIGNYTMEDGVLQVVAKAMNLGCFWSSMHKDANELIRACDDCQAHAYVPRLPKADMISVTSAWPFMKWGIDIVGPLSEGPGRVKYLIVATDYFTKWMEAKPLATITVGRANRSLLRGIKTKLENGGLAYEPNVLWTHRTMKKTSNGEIPFSLTYGTEVVIPAEIGMPTHKTSSVNEKINDQELRLN